MSNPAKNASKAHDTDLLLASNVSTFRQWLITQGYTVVAPDRANKERGVHYWVEIPGCKPVSVQEGFGRKARYAQTHYRLRPIVSSFLVSPVASAIKEVVRTKVPVLQAVVAGKVQTTAGAAPAANTDVPAILQTPYRDPSAFLLSGADIGRALNIDSPIPADVVARDVFGVRVSGGMRAGRTVVAHMKVYDSPEPVGRSHRFVEVVDYPICTDSDDIKQQAADLFQRAAALPNATILVDMKGLGTEFLQHLQTMASPTVNRYGLMMGQSLPKRGGAGRFFNRRAECSVLTAQAIKDGAVKLVRPLSPAAANYETTLEQLGSGAPYSFDECGRYRVTNPEQWEYEHAASADLFEAISLAFQSTELPLAVEKPPAPPVAGPAPVQDASPSAKPLSAFLIELRDDFAITCPLTMEEGETPAAFANRRWVYAQAMIDARPV
jgi:hypothetical protein